MSIGPFARMVLWSKIKFCMKQITKSAQEPKKLAQDIAKKLKGGEVLALVGELGAGKTTFVQGLAEYFGDKENVSSPTFTLINEYQLKPRKLKSYKLQALIHIDCYRLETPQELLDIGFRDYLDNNNLVVVIEWAEKVKKILPKNTLWIFFEHGRQENERIIQTKKP